MVRFCHDQEIWIAGADQEDPASLARLARPMTALEELPGIVVIDEIQHQPDLFQVLRVLADRKPLRARFLMLGTRVG
jgi:predicted AAA+ superfamily ATPase